MEGDVRAEQVGGCYKKIIHKVDDSLGYPGADEKAALAVHGADLIIAKHAPIFRPIKDLQPRALGLAQNQIYIDLIKISMIS